MPKPRITSLLWPSSLRYLVTLDWLITAAMPALSISSLDDSTTPSAKASPARKRLRSSLPSSARTESRLDRRSFSLISIPTHLLRCNSPLPEYRYSIGRLRARRGHLSSAGGPHDYLRPVRLSGNRLPVSHPHCPELAGRPAGRRYTAGYGIQRASRGMSADGSWRGAAMGGNGGGAGYDSAGREQTLCPCGLWVVVRFRAAADGAAASRSVHVPVQSADVPPACRPDDRIDCLATPDTGLARYRSDWSDRECSACPPAPAPIAPGDAAGWRHPSAASGHGANELAGGGGWRNRGCRYRPSNTVVAGPARESGPAGRGHSPDRTIGPSGDGWGRSAR